MHHRTPMDQLGTVQPELADLPLPLLVPIVLLQPIILLLIATAVGCILVPRMGLVSFVYEKAALGTPIWPRLKPQFVPALVFGLIFSIVVVVLDMAFLRLMGGQFTSIESQASNLLVQLGVGVLYGGITEELLKRWGFMSFLVWLGSLVLRRSGSIPPKGVVWAAILLSAVLFGVGHLPAMAALVPLTTIIILRTVLLNAIGGVVFGWLFWRYSLETAMVAHAFAHVGFFLVGLIA